MSYLQEKSSYEVILIYNEFSNWLKQANLSKKKKQAKEWANKHEKMGLLFL